jgi:hypothetical protein
MVDTLPVPHTIPLTALADALPTPPTAPTDALSAPAPARLKMVYGWKWTRVWVWRKSRMQGARLVRKELHEFLECHTLYRY